MSDVAGAAPAAPEPVAVPAEGAPLNETGANFTSPLGSQIPPDAQAKPEAPKPEPKSIDASLDRAIAKNAAKAQEQPKAEPKDAPKPDPKPEPAKPAMPRAEDGRFAPREAKADSEKPVQAETDKPATIEPPKAKTPYEAPKRFIPEAQAHWDSTPEPVQAEISRTIKNLEQGIEKHRATAERYEAIKEFDEMARQGGTDLKTALANYTGIEKLLLQDPIKGFEKVAENLGVPFRQIAEAYLNRTPEQQQSQADQTIAELKRELGALKQQVGGVTQTIQQQREQSTLQEVNKFAADHPRFEELAEDIAFFMKSGKAKDLSEAYDFAERLNPAPQVKAPTPEPVASSAPPAPDPAEQIRKGSKSVHGAPAAGLTGQGKKRVALSLDESLDRAFGSVG